MIGNAIKFTFSGEVFVMIEDKSMQENDNIDI